MALKFKITNQPVIGRITDDDKLQFCKFEQIFYSSYFFVLLQSLVLSLMKVIKVIARRCSKNQIVPWCAFPTFRKVSAGFSANGRIE